MQLHVSYGNLTAKENYAHLDLLVVTAHNSWISPRCHIALSFDTVHFLTRRVHIFSVRSKLCHSPYPPFSRTLHLFLSCVSSLPSRNVFRGSRLTLPSTHSSKAIASFFLFWSIAHRSSSFCLILLPSFYCSHKTHSFWQEIRQPCILKKDWIGLRDPRNVVN